MKERKGNLRGPKQSGWKPEGKPEDKQSEALLSWGHFPNSVTRPWVVTAIPGAEDEVSGPHKVESYN